MATKPGLHRRAATLIAGAFMTATLMAAGATAAVPPPPGLAIERVAGGSPFDGTWLVIFTCPGAFDGTSGYTRRFLASVRDGTLHGEIGVRDQAAYLALDGVIQPNGSALLKGTGMTGDASYAVGRPSPATPYRFTLQSRFEGNRGTGQRVETRTCEAVFTRQ